MGGREKRDGMRIEPGMRRMFEKEKEKKGMARGGRDERGRRRRSRGGYFTRGFAGATIQQELFSRSSRDITDPVQSFEVICSQSLGLEV